MPTDEDGKKKSTSQWSRYVDFLFGKSALEEAAGKKKPKKKERRQSTEYLRERIRETKRPGKESKDAAKD